MRAVGALLSRRLLAFVESGLRLLLSAMRLLLSAMRLLLSAMRLLLSAMRLLLSAMRLLLLWSAARLLLSVRRLIFIPVAVGLLGLWLCGTAVVLRPVGASVAGGLEPGGDGSIGAIGSALTGCGVR